MNDRHEHVELPGVSRRDFLVAASMAAGGIVGGCATNPVSGRKQFMLISEEREVEMDRSSAPHQFSADYGPVQDAALNAYVAEVGANLGALTHRPRMPYSFRVLNAVVVNGYTFPAGSVGLARGLMLSMQSEAELAAVIGHELGHVNARHGAERMSKNLLAMALVTGLAVAVQQENKEYAALAAGLGGLGANLLLCRYSRDDEREADELGMEYMTRAGYTPRGMSDLMDGFRKLHKTQPAAVELLFATHPMSDERYKTALGRIRSDYAGAMSYPDGRERYMDKTRGLRKIAGAIRDFQAGQTLMMKKKYGDAEQRFRTGLSKAPGDYAGLLMMAKCCLAQNKSSEARSYAQKAAAVNPSEPQARHVAGMSKIGIRQYDAALADFATYEKMLPGNANTSFFQGRCHELAGRRRQAAKAYENYCRKTPSGSYAKHANGRLVQWGYRKAPAAR